MRIAMVHSFYSSAQPSGENVVVNDQYEALVADGHQVLMLARETDRLINDWRQTVGAAWTTATGHGSDPSAQLAAFRPDVVHVHNVFPNWGTSWLRMWGERTVATLHNYRSVCAAATLFRDGSECHECLKTPILPAIRHRCYRNSSVKTVPLAVASSPAGSLRFVLHRAARLVVLSRAAQDLFTDVSGRPVDLVPNFTRSTVTTVQGGRGWIFVGRLSREKGVVELVKSWPSNEALDLVGEGPQALEVAAAAAGNPRIRLIGPLTHSQILDRIGGYEGLIVPSLWAEGFPTVVLEALAHGVPIVISNRVAISADLEVQGCACSYEVASGTPELARALARVRDGGHALRTHCLATSMAEYSIDAWRRKILSVYSKVGS